MHRLSVLRASAAVLTVAVSLFAVTAIAAPPQRANVTFEQLSASGVLGDLRIQSNPNTTMFHGTISGLEPNTEYTFVFFENLSCSALTGDLGDEVYTFRSNASGIARIHVKIDEWQLDTIGSISIRAVENGITNLACGEVTPVDL